MVVSLQPGAEPGLGGGGNIDNTIDFGLVDPAIGNLVWNDINDNGMVDIDESGIPGVTVQLLFDSDGSGALNGAELTTIHRSTLTDDDGFYLFADLSPGNFQVVIPASNFDLSGVLEDFPLSSTNVSVDLDNRIDEDDNGIQAGGSGTITVGPLINLTIDAEPIDGSGVNDEFGRGADLDNIDDNNGDMTVDFGFLAMSSKATDFAAFIAETGFTGADAIPSADPDMDGRSNLEEFALCLKAGSGLNGTAVDGGPSAYAGFCIESDGTDINATFLRPEGVSGLTYTLQRTAILGMSTDWTTGSILLDGTNTTVASQGDGTELVTITDVETLAALTSGAGNVRLAITLDSPAETAATKPQGWQTHTVELACETFAYPFEDKQIYGGKGTVSGNILTLDPVTLTAGDDAGAALQASGAQYYVEVIGGDNIGHRIDIDEVASTANTIALLVDGDPCSTQGDANASTLAAIPTTLDADMLVIRRYHTIDELFPPADYQAGADVDTAANLLFFDAENEVFITYFLLDDTTNAVQWVAMGDTPTLTGPGRGAEVLPPGRGAFTHNKAPESAYDLLQIGTIRCNPTIQPLKAGYNLLAATYPVATSPATLGLTAANGFTGTEDPDTADQALTWLGDDTPGAVGYTALFYLIHDVADPGTDFDQWNGVADPNLNNANALDLLESDRSIILDIGTAKPAYTTPVPFN